jgi:hypothetical protein
MPRRLVNNDRRLEGLERLHIREQTVTGVTVKQSSWTILL